MLSSQAFDCLQHGFFRTLENVYIHNIVTQNGVWENIFLHNIDTYIFWFLLLGRCYAFLCSKPKKKKTKTKKQKPKVSIL